MRRQALRLSSALTLVVAAVAAASSPVAARPLAHSPSRHVIVVLRVQHHVAAASGASRAAQLSAYAANRRGESSLLARARRNGARDLHGYGLISAFSATMSAAQASALARDPAVARVFPDLPISMGPSLRQQLESGATGQPARASRAATTASTGPICPANPAQPLLEPEALGLTKTAFADTSTPQAQSIVDGKGVKVAFIADGVDVNNPDFIRGDGTHVFSGYQDFSGDGTAAPTGGAEAFGDASAIAAQGTQTYDLSSFVNPAHPLPPGCNVQIRGVAPGASLIGLKVFGNSSFAPTSHFIDAIDYAVSDHADVLNESFGANPFPDNGNDPITLADNAAIAAGVTVVASTGDAGTTGTVGSPATDPRVIGVGASTAFQTYAQDTTSGEQLSNGSWVSNNISGLSSGGITQNAHTPDLVAPGDLDWALCTANLTMYSECKTDAGSPSPIQDFGGTSQSSPLTAGAAALVIEAYKKTHHGVHPTPALVQRLLTSTATDLGHPAYEQGAGLLNSLAAVQAAESWHDSHGSPHAVGRSLVLTNTQLTAVSRPHAVVSKRVTVRNVSAHTVTVHASTRELGNARRAAHGTVGLNTATAPTYVDSFGINRSFVSRAIKVPSGRDRLDVTIAAQASPAAIRIILLDPHGVYTAYSIPQGASNWAHVDVRHPIAGTWTAFFALSQSSGFNGPVHYLATTSSYTKADAKLATPTFKLKPGKSHTEVMHVREPGHPGDVSASVQFKESHGPTVSVPLTERAVVEPTGGTFTDSISGGNGRGTPALSKFYYLQVPHGAKNLSVGIKLSDPDQLVLATLSGPDGQVASYVSNFNGTTTVKGLLLDQQHPRAGRWVLGLSVDNPASGTALSSPFTVKVAYGAAKVHGSPPDSKKTKLKAGKAVTVPVRITNTSAATQTYFVDPRLSAASATSLGELSGNSTFSLPQPSSVSPFWLVPTHCTSVTESVTADQPVNLDFFFESGEPDVYGSHVGDGATARSSAAQVSPGIWATNVGQVGPFTTPPPAGTATVSAKAKCRRFDETVTTAAGDFWQEGVTGQSAATRVLRAHLPGGGRIGRVARLGPAPLELKPGQSGTIKVTITPSGHAGRVVSGDLYVDSFDVYTDAGNELAAIPYRYTVK